jgi:hypothetical protein
LTTPNQPAPEGLNKLMGVGHYEIGGADTRYGQGIEEDFVTNLVTIPFANFGDMLGVLAQVLLKLPMEALAAFSSLVPDWIDGGETHGSAIEKILGILDPRQALQSVEDFLTWVGEVFTPLKGLVEGINAMLDRVIEFIQAIVDAIIEGIRGIPFFGPPLAALLGAVGFDGADDPVDVIGITAAGVKDVVATYVEENITSIPINMHNEWFGTGDGEGVPEEVAVTVAAIRTAVAGGFTLQTFTASDAAWAVPPELLVATEAWAGAIGGGGKGGEGSRANTGSSGIPVPGGFGGLSGGYTVEKFDPTTLGATLAITIGVAASSDLTTGGLTSIGSLVTSTPNSSGIASPQGYQVSTSAPGNGGSGGDVVRGVSAANGVTGDSSATAAGGAGGAGTFGSGSRTGGVGSAGASGETSDAPITGGGGGGGGGGACDNSVADVDVFGGDGGNGGYPGGASGGGGGASVGNSISTVDGGLPGTPAHGFAFLLWR